MAKLDLTVFQGNTFKKTITFTDKNNELLNISGWTFYFTVKTPMVAKESVDDSNAIKKIIIPVTDGLSGRVTIEWDEIDADPGDYLYDLTVKNPDGVYTLLYGQFTIKLSVTKVV